MDDNRRKLLKNYTAIFFLSSFIMFILGFIEISSANGVLNTNSPLIMTDIAIGISLVLIGCILLLGSILFLIKAND